MAGRRFATGGRVLQDWRRAANIIRKQFRSVENFRPPACEFEALRQKPEGRGFDSRWCHSNFSLT